MGLESRDRVSEVFLEALLRSKCKASNLRMQAVGTYHQVEAALACLPEAGPHVILLLLQADDFIVEDNLRRAFDLLNQQSRELAASERHIASVGQLSENAGSEASQPLAGLVDNPHLAHVVADAVDVPYQAHALRNVVSEAPEVDDVTARARLRRTFDQGRLKPRGPQPKRKRRSGDSCPRNQNGFAVHAGNVGRETAGASLDHGSTLRCSKKKRPRIAPQPLGFERTGGPEAAGKSR